MKTRERIHAARHLIAHIKPNNVVLAPLSLKIMKTRRPRLTNRTRLHWWSALPALFVIWSLVLQPSHLCLLFESGSHSHSHAPASAHSHHHHADEAVAERHNSPKMPALPAPEEDSCCSSGVVPLAILANSSRFTVPVEQLVHLTFAPAVLPVSSDVFALTNCHGRDGPPRVPLPSQFLLSSFLGRAPPVSV